MALKTHHSIRDLATGRPDWASLLIPNDVPTNVVLGATHALVTDYSSIFVDFLPLPGPLVFFSEDAHEYLATRGTYFPSGELPGPFCTELEAVAETILGQAARDDTLEARRADWRSRLVGTPDGHAAQRIADIVFRGKPAGEHERLFAADNRTSIVLHVGSLRSNGITSAALNLLNSIDSSQFDVSVVFMRPAPGSQSETNQRRIPSHVRQFIRLPAAQSTTDRMLKRLSFFISQKPTSAAKPRTNYSWQRQWSSVFGKASFDHIVDFDGYGPFWANLMLRGAAKTHSIWLHNDMASEQHRIIDGRRRIKRSLGAVLALYPRFDYLVSVSPALRDLNRSSLAERLRLDSAAFRSARNIVDGQHVLEAATAAPLENDSDVSNEGASLLAELVNPARETRWFVTVGRLSTEKNHAQLIRAFHQVHTARPESRLMIIGGGPLHVQLAELVVNLGLKASVTLAGYLPNPFPLVSAADCFVMSSRYEGQPMVLLEAALLGLPIVSVNFTTVRDAFPGSWVRVVEQDDAALAQGMLESVADPHRFPALDFAAYNSMAFAEFTRAIGVGRSNPPHALTEVLIVNGDDPLGEALSPLLLGTETIEVVGRASTAAESIALMRTIEPDLVLVIGSLSDGNGVELTRTLRNAYPELRAIVIVSRDDAGTYGAICVGPDGFTVTDIPTSQFVEALRNVALGRRAIDNGGILRARVSGGVPDFGDDQWIPSGD